MKQITKQAEPQEVIDWKSDANEHWQPSYRELFGLEKRALRKSLLEEQGYICCYCNRDISDDDFHIEHFRPQETYKSLELEYVNLHASCIKNKAPNAPSHCGDAKANWFDDALALSPLDNHEASFSYKWNGEIQAAIANANHMIMQLNLNDESLIAKRKAEIFGMLDPETIEHATDLELVTLYHRISSKIGKKYQPFTIALQQQIKQLLPPKVIASL